MVEPANARVADLEPIDQPRPPCNSAGDSTRVVAFISAAIIFAGVWNSLAPLNSQPMPSDPALPTTGFVVDVNHADPVELTLIPKIGDAMAQRIVAQRSILGGFASPEDLAKTKGIGANRVSQVAAFIRLDKRER